MYIKEVIFDIDDTLYEYAGPAETAMVKTAEYVQRELGIPEEEFRRIYYKTFYDNIDKFSKDNPVIHCRTIRMQNVLEYFEKPPVPHARIMHDIYLKSFIEAIVPFPGCIEAMRELSSLGCRIGIGTDMTALMQHGKLDHMGCGPYINHIVTSQEAGHEKPHPEFMALCLQKAGCAPDECVFVGDNPKKDIIGAVRAGMRAVWFNNVNAEFPEDLNIDRGSFREIHSYDELVPYIRSLG